MYVSQRSDANGCLVMLKVSSCCELKLLAQGQAGLELGF